MTTTAAETLYDAYAEFYTALVQSMLADQGGFWHATRAVFDARLNVRRVLDVGCGEGHLGRHLTQFGLALFFGGVS